MCYQIATIDGINAANTTSACALARTEITQYRQSLAALEYKHARYVAAIHYAQQKHTGQRPRLQLCRHTPHNATRRAAAALRRGRSAAKPRLLHRLTFVAFVWLLGEDV